MLIQVVHVLKMTQCLVSRDWHRANRLVLSGRAMRGWGGGRSTMYDVQSDAGLVSRKSFTHVLQPSPLGSRLCARAPEFSEPRTVTHGVRQFSLVLRSLCWADNFTREFPLSVLFDENYQEKEAQEDVTGITSARK
ncbi:hypothetical protein DIPPA_65080 [Diplonema papillatum]|nr:hypothetical protein DIPPA_65080 [Diplonema papillatum]